MKVRVGINGLGRIGKAVLRAIFEIEKYNKQIEVVAVNSSLNVEQCAHLIKYDSVHGKFSGDIDFDKFGNWISLESRKFFLYRERNPENIPWNVDIVFECTGKFNKYKEATRHNVARVIVSAPVLDADVTIIYGTNDNILKKEHRVISAGSCTTNCLVSVVNVLHCNLGIKNGFMTAIHAYTNDQNILDGNHRDLRRARACGLSIIPTTTGAKEIIGSIFPELNGKLDGTAIRVPVSNVSLIDFKFIPCKKVTVEEINKIFERSINGVLSVCTEPLVSIDFVHDPHSAIVDLASTFVTGDVCRVAAWYDNEWAFSLRMLDIALLCSTTL